MNTIKCFNASMIILLGLFPYENNAARLSPHYTTSNVDIQYKTELRGSSLYLKKFPDDSFVSPFNDFPLNTGQEGVFRAVIVIPKLKRSKAKEIRLDWDMNPIREMFMAEEFVLQWAYGVLMQTWDDPCEIDPITNHMGDNGQLDVMVVSEHSYDCGAVVIVKIVGAYPMIILKTGMTSWQMIAIDAKDWRAESVNNITDFNRGFSDMLVKNQNWVEEFNVKFGNPINKILDPVDAETALKVITNKLKQWKTWQEVQRYAPYINPYNTTLNNKWTMAPWMNLDLY